MIDISKNFFPSREIVTDNGEHISINIDIKNTIFKIPEPPKFTNDGENMPTKANNISMIGPIQLFIK